MTYDLGAPTPWSSWKATLRLSTERLDMIPESPKRIPTEASLVRFQFVQRFAGWLL